MEIPVSWENTSARPEILPMTILLGTIKNKRLPIQSAWQM